MNNIKKYSALVLMLILTFGLFNSAEATLIRYDVSSYDTILGRNGDGDQFSGYLILNDLKHITTFPGNPNNYSFISYVVYRFDFTVNGASFASDTGTSNSGVFNFQWYPSLNNWGYVYMGEPMNLVSDSGGSIFSGSATDNGSWTTQGPDPNAFNLPQAFGYYVNTHSSNIPNVYGSGRFYLSNATTVPEPPALLLLGIGLVCLAVYSRRKNNTFKQQIEIK